MPRDTAHKWLAFGAIVVVAVGTSFASSAFKKHLRSTLPEAAPPTPYEPAITSAPSSPPAFPNADPDEDAPPADDPRIAPSGTPATSSAARPSWWPKDDGWAPVHTWTGSLFASGSVPSAGNLSKAFVMCHAATTPGTEADVRVRAKLGELPAIAADGPSDQDYAHFTAPLVDLKNGEPIEVVVSTQAEGGFREVIRLKTKLGEQLEVTEKDGTVDCVVLSGDALLDQIAADAGRADSAIARLAARKLDASATPDWGYPSNDVRIAKHAVADVAALTGWDDARAKRRVDAYARALAAVDADRARVFEELRRSASDQAKVGKVTFAVASPMSCDPQPSRDARCSVSFVVTNDSATALVWGRDVKIDVADASSAHTALPPAGERDAIVPPHQTQTLRVSPGWRAKPGPTVAQIRAGGAAAVIKIR